MGPALAVLELRSIARGYFVLDAMAKRALVTVLHAEPVSPGKFWIALEGGEAEIEEALLAGLDVAADARVDHAHLPNAHDSLLAAVAGAPIVRPAFDAVGVLELATMSSTIRAADASLKCADVALVDLHLARGIGGKGYLVLTGALSDVEAAIDAGADAAGVSAVVGREIMANPDEAVTRAAGRRR